MPAASANDPGGPPRGGDTSQMMTGLSDEDATTSVTVVKFAGRKFHGKNQNDRGLHEVPGPLIQATLPPGAAISTPCCRLCEE